MVSQGNSSGVKIAQVLFSIFVQRGFACQEKGLLWKYDQPLIQCYRWWVPSWEPIFSIEILSPRLPSLGHTWNCDLALAAEFLLGDPFFPTQVDAPPESPGSGPRVQAIFTLPLPSSYTPASSQPWQMEINKLFNYSHRRLQHFLCDQRGYNIQFEYDILYGG